MCFAETAEVGPTKSARQRQHWINHQVAKHARVLDRVGLQHRDEQERGSLRWAAEVEVVGRDASGGIGLDPDIQILRDRVVRQGGGENESDGVESLHGYFLLGWVS
jgi:hypothetical protein